MKLLVELWSWFIILQVRRYDLETLDVVIFHVGVGSLLPSGRRLVIRWTITDGVGRLRWQVGHSVFQFRAPIESVHA